jgi:hypothetical protein
LYPSACFEGIRCCGASREGRPTVKLEDVEGLSLGRRRRGHRERSCLDGRVFSHPASNGFGPRRGLSPFRVALRPRVATAGARRST